MAKTLRRLQKLMIEETSGVDRPASGLDGWLVMKSRDGEPDEAVTELLKHLREQHTPTPLTDEEVVSMLAKMHDEKPEWVDFLAARLIEYKIEAPSDSYDACLRKVLHETAAIRGIS